MSRFTINEFSAKKDANRRARNCLIAIGVLYLIACAI